VSEPAVLVERDQHILTLTINRPAKRNAFNAEVLCRLSDAWDLLDGDAELRVAILTGAVETSPPEPIWINWSAP
jgi:enoyl-CoA hydratase